MSSAKSVASRYVINNYGNTLSVDEPTFDQDSKTWTACIKTDFPRVIKNDKEPKEIIVKFLSIKDLGVLRFTDDFKILEKTSIKECKENFIKSLKLWQDRAEKIVVAASANNLARIADTRVFLNPILNIVSNLQKKEIITDEEVDLFERPIRMKQYLMMLDELQIVRRVDKAYTYGNLFVELQAKERDPDKLELAILAYVLENSYSLIREQFKIAQLEKFVHVDSCYYIPSLEAEKPLYLRKDTIINRCAEEYGERDVLSIQQILDKLVRVDALEYSAPYYHANDTLFTQMLDMKNALPELASPVA